MSSDKEFIEKGISAGIMETKPTNDNEVNIDSGNPELDASELEDATNSNNGQKNLSKSVGTMTMDLPKDDAINVVKDELVRVLNEIENSTKLSHEIMTNFTQQSEVNSRILENYLDERMNEVENLTMAKIELNKQSLLRYNVVIFGVPLFNNENTAEVLFAIADAISVKLFLRDVRKVHRVNAHEYSPIFVEFNSMDMKQAFLKAGKSIPLRNAFKSISTQFADRKIIIRSDLTPYFRSMLKRSFSAVRDGRLKAAWLESSGLVILFMNGNKLDSVISMDELESIIDAIPKPLEKPCRRMRRSARAKQRKNMPSKNRRRRKRGNQRRNKRLSRKQNQGIFRIERFLIRFFFLFFTDR